MADLNKLIQDVVDAAMSHVGRYSASSEDRIIGAKDRLIAAIIADRKARYAPEKVEALLAKWRAKAKSMLITRDWVMNQVGEAIVEFTDEFAALNEKESGRE